MSSFVEQQREAAAAPEPEPCTETHYPRPFEIGVAAGGALFCAVALGAALFAGGGLMHFAGLAEHAIK